jgi:hypothetical protein
MALDLSATEIGISAENYPHKVWGVVMETGLDDGYYTLVVLADGTTSLYFSTGGGVIGAGQHAKVKAASRQFIDLGDRMVGLAQPAASKAPPAPGSTTFFFLTFDGLRSYSAKEVELGEERDALAALFHAGHGVIASVRETEP